MNRPLDDTTDLRTGAPIHDDLLALLPLVGEWDGGGVGRKPSDGAEFSYRQQVRFSHDGRRFLVYESRSWLIDEAGDVIRPALRESGFWRPGSADDDIEVVLSAMTGLIEAFTGRAGDLRWQLTSGAVIGTPTATPVAHEARLYALVEDELRYVTELSRVTELSPPGSELTPHLNGVLRRR